MRTTEEYYCAFGLSKVLKDVDTGCYDVKLPEPFENDVKCVDLLKHGKVYKKGKNGTVVYKYTYDNMKTLYEECLTQTFAKKKYNITSYIDKHFNKTFNSLKTETKYALKAIIAPTYRDMVYGLKEISIQDEIYTNILNIGCETMIYKPYFCMPYWDGEKWFFLIATEFAKGIRLSDMIGPKIFCSMKKTVQTKVDEALHTLWWCGYSHNNLSKDHIIYNKKNNTIKFVGLSNCVIMPYNKVECFRTNLNNSETSFEEQFELVFKEDSMRLASFAETFGRTDDFVISSKIF